MTIVGGIVIFSITWMVVLFTVLPWGVRSQLEEEDIEPGTVESAPVNPQIWKKFAITTLITGILFALFWSSIEFGWIDYRALVEQ
ncbi:MAG: DUF1467 family protein [Sneathiellales bacterium]|nr:DUF1467 family protein [Sneathiellales bacterium]